MTIAHRLDAPRSASTAVLLLLAFGISLTSCSSSIGSGPVVAPGVPALQQVLRKPASRELATPAPSAAPSAAPAFAFVQFGGYQGEHYRAFRAGKAIEYSETVAVRFNEPIATKSFTYALSPAAPSSVYFGNQYTREATFTIRKVPGTTYTLTIPAGTEDQNGDALQSPVVETFTTQATPRNQKPGHATTGQPYRYGVLEHPFPASLSGSNAAQQIATLASAGVRFVRIDYCGAQSEPSSAGTFDFKTEDAIMDQLAAKGITELPIIEQYCSPAWANGGSTASTPVWSSPQSYAAFAAGVAAHVAAKYPQITRMELFNEPNLASWWNAPAPYADTTGGATAAYMAAAYAAVKAVAPTMTIVGPALSDGGTGVLDPRIFLQNMYAAGCKTGVCWDVLSVHNYAWMNPDFYVASSYYNRFEIYKDLQAIAQSHGDPKPHVMLTEWGVSADPASPSGFDPAVQAQYLSIALNKIDADRTVDGLVYTNIYNPSTDFFALMALTDASFNPLPGFNVYQAFAAR